MMENVLLKLNIKGGGHNYNVKPEIFAYVIFLRYVPIRHSSISSITGCPFGWRKKR